MSSLLLLKIQRYQDLVSRLLCIAVSIKYTGLANIKLTLIKIKVILK